MNTAALLLAVLLVGLTLGFGSVGWDSDLKDVLNSCLGWTYATAWSVSFYPQVILNWKRKSVVGLSFDFLGLNLIGWVCYSGFNVALYAFNNKLVEVRHRDGTPRVVELNDVVFALHALVLTSITVFQCLIYERGKQRVSHASRAFIVLLGIFLVAYGLSIATLACQHCHKLLNWLSFVYFLSYVKMMITLIKYTPQLWFNFRRKSTVGWNIHNVILDLTGGVLSTGQVFLTCYLLDDWSAILGNPVKFGLGVASLVFDVLFMIQHYILYPDSWRETDQGQLNMAEAGHAMSVCTILHHLVHHPELLPNSVCDEMCHRYTEHGIDVDIGAVLAYFERHPDLLDQQWVLEILAASGVQRRSSSGTSTPPPQSVKPSQPSSRAQSPQVSDTLQQPLLRNNLVDNEGPLEL